jgi:hypothetical protein
VTNPIAWITAVSSSLVNSAHATAYAEWEDMDPRHTLAQAIIAGVCGREFWPLAITTPQSFLEHSPSIDEISQKCVSAMLTRVASRIDRFAAYPFEIVSPFSLADLWVKNDMMTISP